MMQQQLGSAGLRADASQGTQHHPCRQFSAILKSGGFVIVGMSCVSCIEMLRVSILLWRPCGGFWYAWPLLQAGDGEKKPSVLQRSFSLKGRNLY